MYILSHFLLLSATFPSRVLRRCWTSGGHLSVPLTWPWLRALIFFQRCCLPLSHRSTTTEGSSELLCLHAPVCIYTLTKCVWVSHIISVASLLLHPLLCHLVGWVGGTSFALFNETWLNWCTLTCPGFLSDWPCGKERPRVAAAGAFFC